MTHKLPTTKQEEIGLDAFFKASLPLPPSVNQSYKIVRLRNFIRIGSSSALEQFKRDAQLLLSQAQQNRDIIQAIQETNNQHRHVHLGMDMTVYFSTMWKRDLDGVVKAITDVVFAHLHMNDNQVVQLIALKQVDAQNPRVEVEVYCVVR